MAVKHDLANIRGVLLDWAGTTIDYGSRAPTQVFIEMFRRRGISITEAEARGPMGSAKRDHIAAILAMPRIQSLWQQQYGQASSHRDVDAIYAEFLPLQKSTLAEHCQLIPGVAAAIDRLRQHGLRIGSSTGYTRALMEVVLPLAASQGYAPEVTLCADDVREGRPAPWMNFHAAEQLGIYPLCDMLVVDDTTVGIAAGKNSGAVTVAVILTGNALGLSLEQVEQLSRAELDARLEVIERDFRRAGADYVLHSAAQLPELLGLA